MEEEAPKLTPKTFWLHREDVMVALAQYIAQEGRTGLDPRHWEKPKNADEYVAFVIEVPEHWTPPHDHR